MAASDSGGGQKDRYFLLIIGIGRKVRIVNRHYVWNRFVNFINQRRHWPHRHKRGIRIFVVTENWPVPVDMDGRSHRSTRRFDGGLVALGRGLDSVAS